MHDKLREEKQKVTLYLPQDLHRKLKVRAAVDAETMTDIAQRAIVFYLENSELIEQHGVFGQSHQVYGCPECASHLVVRKGELVTVGPASRSVLLDEELAVSEPALSVGVSQQGGGELIHC
jgi:hypothetical protein